VRRRCSCGAGSRPARTLTRYHHDNVSQGPSAAECWRRDLESWAIPEEVLRAAPESPYGFPADLFARSTAQALSRPEETPSCRAALEALGRGGSVLDVGCGAGAASLPLAPPAKELVGVDESPEMLVLFAQGAQARGVTHREVQGRWPEVAGSAPQADVVVCHHVVYNVADLVPFLDALTHHAKRRVVLELTARHPQSELNGLWLAIHGIRRPERPTATDAVAVAEEMGLRLHVEQFEAPSLWDTQPLEERVAFARRRLCVGPERDGEIARWLKEAGDRPRQLVAAWWDTGRAPESTQAPRH
jgi:SAM-dependent methyltransferase